MCTPWRSKLNAQNVGTALSAYQSTPGIWLNSNIWWCVTKQMAKYFGLKVCKCMSNSYQCVGSAGLSSIVGRDWATHSTVTERANLLGFNYFFFILHLVFTDYDLILCLWHEIPPHKSQKGLKWHILYAVGEINASSGGA